MKPVKIYCHDQIRLAQHRSPSFPMHRYQQSSHAVRPATSDSTLSCDTVTLLCEPVPCNIVINAYPLLLNKGLSLIGNWLPFSNCRFLPYLGQTTKLFASLKVTRYRIHSSLSAYWDIKQLLFYFFHLFSDLGLCFHEVHRPDKRNVMLSHLWIFVVYMSSALTSCLCFLGSVLLFCIYHCPIINVIFSRTNICGASPCPRIWTICFQFLIVSCADTSHFFPQFTQGLPTALAVFPP